MTTDLPLRLEDFGLSARTGFLGATWGGAGDGGSDGAHVLPVEPLRRLQDPYSEPWERLVDDLSHLLVAWKLREHIRKVFHGRFFVFKFKLIILTKSMFHALQ